MSRTALLVVLTFAGAAFFSGCGGDKVEKVDADEWVEDLCGATEDLSDDEAEAFDDYQALFDDSDDGEKVRDGLSEYVDAYNDALDKFAKSIERAGQPDVRDGDKVLEAVTAFVKDERRAVDRAEREAKDLDEDGIELVDAVDEVFFSIEFGDLLELLEESDSPDADDIIELIDEDQDCANFLFVD